MSYPRGSYQFRTTFGGFGGPPSRDVMVLVGVVFATFAMQFFASTAIIPALLHLSPAVWRLGFVWEVGTYAFTGYGPASLWILLELLMLYWFGSDVFSRLGRRRFWGLLAGVAAASGVVAVVVELVAGAVWQGGLTAFPFQIMQGQRMLLVILIAAFATLYGEATILFFFVLPLKARWFLWLEVLIAFIAFLSSHDLAGFAGVCAGTLFTFLWLSPGGPKQRIRRWRLRWQQDQLQRKLERMRRKRNMHVVDDDRKGGGPGSWVN